MKKITSFTGKYFFLSNFYGDAGFWMDGIFYPSSEHAYMSGKTDDIGMKIKISKIKTPGECKKFCSKKSNNFKLVGNWEDIKYSHMEKVLKIKFSIPEMEEKLLETKGCYLVEGNTWGDRIWGQCPVGVGKNWLGEILMSIRGEKLLWL